jgi:hypothetical protein
MLWWESMRFLSHQVSWADFGAAPGLRNVRDGLAQYKQAWATAVRPVYFCGSVFDQDKYDYLVNAIKSANPKYFPAYRFGEFG